MEYTFDNIRPFRDSEVQQAVAELIKEDDFHKVSQFLYKENYVQVLENLKQVKSIEEFQVVFIKPVLESIIQSSTDGFTFSGGENLPKDEACLFISNHRDIVMDPALIDYGLHLNGMDTVEIAIGSNLLIMPWIEMMVKLNRCFVVRRGVQGRELLLSSKNMSSYIHDTVVNRNDHVWIAQREGRAKDGNDRTHSGILRMLNMGSGSKNPIEGLSKLNIVPVSLSYEFDPCDVLKAKELAVKASGKDFVKTEAEDLQSMALGMRGYKGRVHLHFSRPINEEMKSLQVVEGRDLFEDVAAILDSKIHSGFKIFDSHKAAAAMVHPDRFSADNSVLEKFRQYVFGQLEKYKADQQLFDFIALQYANPAINAKAASDNA